MTTLQDYSVETNLVNEDLLICVLTQDDIIFESRIIPDHLTSGILNLKKLKLIIDKNSKEPQTHYIISIDKIDTYNMVLHVMFSDDLIEFGEQINFKLKNLIDEQAEICKLKQIIKKLETKNTINEYNINLLSDRIETLCKKINRLESEPIYCGNNTLISKKCDITFYVDKNNTGGNIKLVSFVKSIYGSGNERVELGCRFNYHSYYCIEIYNSTSQTITQPTTLLNLKNIIIDKNVMPGYVSCYNVIDYYLSERSDWVVNEIHINTIDSIEQLIGVLVKYTNYKCLKINFEKTFDDRNIKLHCERNNIEYI